MVGARTDEVSFRASVQDRVAVELSPARRAVGSRVTLSARVQDVRIQFIAADGPEQLTLVANTVHVLARVGDDSWRPLRAVPASALDLPMLMTDRDGLLHLRDLGPGSYALELSNLELENGDAQLVFQVPGPEALDIICRSR